MTSLHRYLFSLAFGLGALALVWVCAMVASSHPLVLVMTALIAAVYVFGALELRQYRSSTQALAKALQQIPEDLQDLSGWLVMLPAAWHNPVRQRIEGERAGLPGPALTPYLVGLLVMLGMLGTFLGMVVTLNGAVFALEGSSELAGIRAAFAEPIKGLGLAFGTSVAGVATSAMLGLMSSLARRERAQVSHLLDTCIATRLRGFSLTHQRQATYQAMQQQALALPQVVQQLQAMMAQLTETHAQSQAQLTANQQSFHLEVQNAYQALAQSVDQSLRSHLSQGLQSAVDSLRPVVQTSMGQVAEQAQQLNEQLRERTQQHLTTLQADLQATAQGVVAQLQVAQTAQQARIEQADQIRLQTWNASLAQMASQLEQQWQTASANSSTQQQAIGVSLEHTAQEIATQTQTQAAQLANAIQRLMASGETLLQSRKASEAQWAKEHQERAQALTTILKQELTALREAESQRGQAAVERLSELQSVVTTHLQTLGTALEAPIARLIDTASQAPLAAAQVIGQMRQEISVSVARDNALLEERTRIMDTLSHLLDAINHASTEQRQVIDSLVSSSASTLQTASAQFTTQVGIESAKLGDVAAQVTASAVDVASLGDALGGAVRSFSDTNAQLMQQLERIEQALDKSMARSDEQLAYYVAQAREIIDLSITSQKDVLDSLRVQAAQGAAG